MPSKPESARNADQSSSRRIRIDLLTKDQRRELDEHAGKRCRERAASKK